MPRYTLNFWPPRETSRPGLSSVPASRLPTITVSAPAAIAFATSPGSRMPPSAITGTPCLAAGRDGVEHRRQLRHADARDDARRAGRARPDADLDRVGAGAGRGRRRPRRWRRCRPPAGRRAARCGGARARGRRGRRGRGRCRARARRRRPPSAPRPAPASRRARRRRRRRAAGRCASFEARGRSRSAIRSRIVTRPATKPSSSTSGSFSSRWLVQQLARLVQVDAGARGDQALARRRVLADRCRPAPPAPGRAS